MDDFSLRDLWWLQPKGPDNPLPAMQLGAQIVQQKAAMDLKERDLANDIARTSLMRDEVLYKQKIQMQLTEGNAAIAKTISEITDWSDPKQVGTIWQTVSKYPLTADSKAVAGAMYMERSALAAKAKLSAADSTPASKNLAIADRMEKIAKLTEDPARAEQLRRDATLLRSTITAPTESIETYKDENGNQQFRITRGPTTGAPGGLSTAVKTGLQQGLLGGERAMEIGVKAFNQMSPASVGVQGQVNKTLINEGLAQVFPGMKKDDVTEAQTLVGLFNEQAVKAITAGGDRRVSDKDMARFRAILPKMSAMESVGSARQKIATFMEDMRREAQTDAKALGSPLPEWALTQQQVLDMYGTNAISRAKAAELLMKYHPNPEQ